MLKGQCLKLAKRYGSKTMAIWWTVQELKRKVQSRGCEFQRPTCWYVGCLLKHPQNVNIDLDDYSISMYITSLIWWSIWGGPRMWVPKNGWFIMENPNLKWIISAYSHDLGNLHISLKLATSQSTQDAAISPRNRPWLRASRSLIQRPQAHEGNPQRTTGQWPNDAWHWRWLVGGWATLLKKCSLGWLFPIWGCPWGYPQMENPIKIDDLGVPLFQETSIHGTIKSKPPTRWLCCPHGYTSSVPEKVYFTQIIPFIPYIRQKRFGSIRPSCLLKPRVFFLSNFRWCPLLFFLWTNDGKGMERWHSGWNNFGSETGPLDHLERVFSCHTSLGLEKHENLPVVGHHCFIRLGYGDMYRVPI